MSWKIIWKSLRNSDMSSRLLAVLGMILVFRLLAVIPIPVSDPQSLRELLDTLLTAGGGSQFLSFLNIASGGALANFSIMIVGLGPYINASIIMQLLTRAIPKLETLNKEGEFGRKKINQYTRMLTFPLAIIQSVGAIFLVRQAAASIEGTAITEISSGVSIAQWFLMVSALTTGAMILMWLGELITEKGVGNGISLLITASIVSALPTTINDLSRSVIDQERTWNILGLSLPVNSFQLMIVTIIAVSMLVLTVLVVKLNEASRKITIQYAKRVQGNRAYGGVTTTLPVKLITAGVIPIIFAVAFLSIPSFAGQLLLGSANPAWQELGQNLSLWFAQPSAQTFLQGNGLIPYIYPVTYFTLVFLFTFFYTNITFNAKEIAENLQKQGGFIEDIRPGEQTEKYLSKVVNRLTLFGATALGLIATVPIIGEVFLGNNLAIAGTSVLILVAVALESLRKIESRALMVTYDQYEQPDFFGDITDDEKSNSDSGEPSKKRVWSRKSKK
ncbi:preprotein translocase subunit SecY [soil metagenome]